MVLLVAVVVPAILWSDAGEATGPSATEELQRSVPALLAPESSSPSNEPELVRTRTESPAAVAEEPGYHRVRVRVIDDAGTAIEGAQVTLGVRDKKEYWQSENTDAEGRALLRTPVRIGPLANLTVRAFLPGISTERPLCDAIQGQEVELVFSGIGWIEARIDGEFQGAGLQVVAVEGEESFGSTCSRTFDASTERMAVATGFDYRVLAWSGGERQNKSRVRGPQRAQEVVPVDFDFRRCRVAFRLPEGTSPPGIDAGLLTIGSYVPCKFTVDSAGVCTALVPRKKAAWFVLLHGIETFESVRMDFDEVADLGTVRFERMKLHGVLDAQLENGLPVPTKQAPSAFSFPQGGLLRASMATGRLFLASDRDFGWKIYSLRLFSGLYLRPYEAGHYADPAEVELQDGAVGKAVLRRGAVLELRATATGKLATIWLEHATTRATERSRRSWLEDRSVPAWRFEDLPPGDYELRLEGGEVSPSRVTVPAESTQRVAVDVHMR